MITKEKVLKVVASLKTVGDLANKDGGFDMSKGDVDFDKNGHPCGTAHCLAGLYVVANYTHPYIINARANASVIEEADYLDGAELMANDLGFELPHYLCEWLAENPKAWGNKRGNYIFTDERAFNYPGFSGAIRHLEEFAGRLTLTKGE